MALRILGSFVVLIGLATMIFTAMAYAELQNAATSETAPSIDSMPLTKIVGPELFDPGNRGTKPVTLVRTVCNRIYLVGGVGIVLAVLGVVTVAVPQVPGAKREASP